MSEPSSIDHQAPVLAHHEIDVAAPLDVVWSLHTDVNAWPGWQTDITEAHLEGPLERGTSFAWSSSGLRVTSTVYALTDRARVLWGGTANGITGIHEWLFEETPAGTHVVTNESFSGGLVSANPQMAQQMLDASLAGWLDSLKRAAEARSQR
ncbi:SRPBCC family protein [Modestobacter sp. NPDC049651]|uniref:SRPBCC family protein n=1 Tax=unclassified Modestobacter TaxID=2643866 RepID=UPI0033F0E33D